MTYGLFVWPCAPLLAKYVFHHQDAVVHKHVLEVSAQDSTTCLLFSSIRNGLHAASTVSCNILYIIETFDFFCVQNFAIPFRVTVKNWRAKTFDPSEESKLSPMSITLFLSL